MNVEEYTQIVDKSRYDDESGMIHNSLFGIALSNHI